MKTIKLSLTAFSLMGLINCGTGTTREVTDLKTVKSIDNQIALDDPAHTIRVTVPAGKIVRFTYSLHGDHHMGMTIYNETLDETIVSAHNWYNNSPAEKTAFTQRNSNKAMTYVIAGFGKGCWYNQHRCGQLAWFQEKVQKSGATSARFLAQQFNNAPVINVAWSVFE